MDTAATALSASAHMEERPWWRMLRRNGEDIDRGEAQRCRGVAMTSEAVEVVADCCRGNVFGSAQGTQGQPDPMNGLVCGWTPVAVSVRRWPAAGRWRRKYPLQAPRAIR